MSAHAIFVDDYVKPGDPDDSAGIVAALAAAVSNGGVVLFSGRTYNISQIIDLPSGANLVGTGRVRLRDTQVPGTIIKRTNSVAGFQSIGVSITKGAVPYKHSISLQGITFFGGDYTTDFLTIAAAVSVFIEQCFFTHNQGRHLLLWEVNDSRITNTDFEWGGSGTLSVPMIELRSGSGYDTTNEIHFVGVRCESYTGTALALSGANTNEIFLTNCKFESAQSPAPAITLGSAAVVHFDPVQIFSSGPATAHCTGQIVAINCRGIFGRVLSEHRAGMKLDSLVNLVGCQAVDLDIHSYNPTSGIDPDAVLTYDRPNCRAINVRATINVGGTFQRRLWDEP